MKSEAPECKEVTHSFAYYIVRILNKEEAIEDVLEMA